MTQLRRVAITITVVLPVVHPTVGDTASLGQATFRSRTDVVSVNVSVTQGRQPVGNLTTGDFAITDNGVAQTVDVLAMERAPIDLTLVMAGHQQLLNRGTRDAYFRALTSASSVRRSLLTQDRLRAVWASADIGGGLMANEESLRLRDVDVRRFMGVSVVDGLFYALAWPVEPDRRHLVVAFTEGIDRRSVLDKETLPRLAAHSDAVLHVVFYTSPADYNAYTVTHWLEPDREIVSETARRTGGTVRTGTDAAQDLARIIEDYRTSYVLQYTPRGTPTPGWHKLSVRVTRPGRFDVRARQGYEVGRN